MALANRYAIQYQRAPEDALAEIATRLSGDEVVTDEMEDLLVALKRAGAISGAEMVDLLSLYLTEKYQH
jgi:hypothetical protein|tara:strand:- start:91 stop:297 length:207 start_codon:yes stop_codon:yes gene_type:complete